MHRIGACAIRLVFRELDHRRFIVVLLSTLTLLMSLPVAAATGSADESDSDLLEALRFRNVGPFRGGRSTAVTGVPQDRNTFYMGSTGGGVWKTEDGGIRWANVSDDSFTSASIGAVAVAPSDPNVLYVGTGSACPRGNVSPGDGVYRSTDGGESWDNIGLRDAGQIGRIRVHPTDPDTVFVAALGHIFGPNDERGVFRSRDGGANWEKVLFVSDRAGVVDLSMDPNNPRRLFAAVWETERKPWTLISGGEDSGLYRSIDSGSTWEEVEDGLPSGVKGRIGVAVSPADPDLVWALVEADDGGLFRSDDGGGSFRLVNPDRNFRQRAWYYTHVFADPEDADTLYILNTGLWKSIDGGKSFDFVRAPHGDHHDLWIDPGDSRIMINGNDGGANISYTGGASWSTQENQPTAELYRVTVDQRFPYWLYGCQQDNTCLAIPSRTNGSNIDREDWYIIGGCESGHVAVDPRDPDITYAGCYGGQITRQNHATGQEREIMAYPQLAIGQGGADLRYRFQWNAPIRLSPHDPSILYHTSQFVHRSTDEGQSWETISPDLTRNDTAKQAPAGGPITYDNTGVEVYGTIFAFEESPLVAGHLWAGSDDGLVHLSRDGGASWTDITPARMPEWGQVNSLELSSRDPGRAFLAVTRYKLDDFRPYVFRTDDYGASWQLLTDGNNGIPANHSVRVVREDPDRPGLLFAGTEFGLYLSFDDGGSWRRFQQNLPVTPVTDLAISHQDLVVATQGRSFWILDDLSVLHQLDGGTESADIRLFEPRKAYRVGGGSGFGGGGSVGHNPPNGVVVYYWLGQKAEAEVTLEIVDADGKTLRHLSSEKEEPQAPNPYRRFMSGPPTSRKLQADKGLNRYVWDMRLADATLAEGAVLWGRARGPKVPPGAYRARLSQGEVTQTVDIEILGDPRVDTTAEDYAAQYVLARKTWDALTQSHHLLTTSRDIREQIRGLNKRLQEIEADESLAAAAEAATTPLEAIEDRIYQAKNEASQDVLNFPPRLDNQLVDLLGVIESSDSNPTDGAVERFEELSRELAQIKADFEQVLDQQVGAFTALVAAKNLPAVIVPSL